MSRKQILIVSLAVVLVLILVLVAVFVPKMTGRNAASETDPSASLTTEPQTLDVTNPQTNKTGDDALAPTDTMAETQSAQQSAQHPESAQNPIQTQTQLPYSPEETEPEKIAFPYMVPNTTLEILSVNSYDGIYVEDGSDIEITGVSAIMLKNTGDQCVDFAKIQMKGSKTDLEFVASGIEVGATVAVMESGKAPAVDQDYEQITAEVALTDTFEQSDGIVDVTETEEGSLDIANISGKDIPCVRIFYKFYMEDEQMYIGGITYTAKITDLKAGTSVNVAPSHYAPGGSRIVMVKTYDTVED